MTLSSGQILQSRYRILRPLGQGGMGAVYLAEDQRLAGRQCAIKENAPDPKASPAVLVQLRGQFLAEASVLANLDHPNLPKVSDYFSYGDNEYIVMEYVEGDNLADVLARHGGPLPEKPVLIWADQVLAALEYLHSRQPYPIIHRDIKPGNIILSPQGKVMLVDFGLVKLLDASNPRTATIVHGVGTPEYTPLEQYGGGGHTDARSDIYALGATLYHLLTGVTPLDAHQLFASPASLKPPRQLNPALSPGTEAAILQAMELHPNQRHQSATELRQALSVGRMPSSKTALPSAGPPRPASSSASRGTRLFWGGLLVFALLSIVAVSSGVLLRDRWASVRATAPALTAFATLVISGAHSTPLPATAKVTSLAPVRETPTAVLRMMPSSTGTPALSRTPTSAPTSTASATRTATATSALPPTSVRAPTASPTGPPNAQVIGGPVNLRTGPGTAYSLMGQMKQGASLVITGRDAIVARWWEVELPDGRVAWISASLVLVSGGERVPVRTAPPLPTPQPTSPPAQPSQHSSDTWVLVADSASDYPGPLQGRKWWYLWSRGRNNFNWQDMTFTDDYCYHSPNDWGLTICQDTMKTDSRGDLTLQWKAPQGGKYRFEWNSDQLRFYLHLRYVGSQGHGSELPYSAVFEDVIDWEMFFWVATSDTTYHVKVFRLQN